MEYQEKPTLVVMAAGMGSRYGGLKQIDPVDDEGDKIIDFSVYDAKKAGFGKVIFVIKREIEEAFREAIGEKMRHNIDIAYAFQEVENLPDDVSLPEGRVKPWGTGHAILSCYEQIQGSFAVINADDYYGPEAFSLIYDYLTTHKDDDKYRFCMVGYELKNTVTEHGSVSRGVCHVGEDGTLQSIKEYTKIEKREDGIVYTEDDGETYHPIASDTIVSMNLWGFSKGVMEELKNSFHTFLKETMPANPLKSEFYLPSVISQILNEERGTVEVLKTKEAWMGVTYQEDRASVKEAISAKKKAGQYPANLWDN